MLNLYNCEKAKSRGHNEYPLAAYDAICINKILYNGMLLYKYLVMVMYSLAGPIKLMGPTIRSRPFNHEKGHIINVGFLLWL